MTGTLSVHMPAIWPVVCPPGHSPKWWTQFQFSIVPWVLIIVYSLHRWHSGNGRYNSSGEESPGSADIFADRPGLCHQCVNVSHYPNPADWVPWPESRLCLPTLVSTRGETLPCKDGGQTAFTDVTGISTTAGSTDWETACSFADSSPGPPFYWHYKGTYRGFWATVIRTTIQCCHYRLKLKKSSPGGRKSLLNGMAELCRRKTIISSSDVSPRLWSSLEWHQTGVHVATWSWGCT